MGEGWFRLRVSNGVFFAGCDKRVLVRGLSCRGWIWESEGCCLLSMVAVDDAWVWGMSVLDFGC